MDSGKGGEKDDTQTGEVKHKFGRNIRGYNK